MNIQNKFRVSEKIKIIMELSYTRFCQRISIKIDFWWQVALVFQWVWFAFMDFILKFFRRMILLNKAYIN